MDCKMKKEYDFLIVGSSPVCIAEAILQASLGHRVCLVEKGDFGGSWKYRDLFGLKNIELGPHVFHGDKIGTKAMKLFGIKPVPVDIGYFDIEEEKLHKNNLDASRHQSKIKFWLNRLHKDPINFVKLLYNVYQFFRVKFLKKIPKGYYLKGGTYELLSKLTSNVHWSKVDVIKNRVTGICASSKLNTKVLFETGDVCFVNHVILPLCSDLNLLEIGSESISNQANALNIEQKEFSSTQVVLKIKNNKIHNFFSAFLYGGGTAILVIRIF